MADGIRIEQKGTERSVCRASGKEKIVRYVLTVLLLLVVEIAALGITFVIHWARQPIPPERMRQHHTIQSSQ